MTITWNTDINAPCCPGEILNDDGQSRLVQTDWDYPGTASSFGWSVSSVGPDIDELLELIQGEIECLADAQFTVLDEINGDDRISPVELDELRKLNKQIDQHFCEHDETDGTVDCKKCGLLTSDFIYAAYEWLIANDGATADDPGYFDNGE